MSYNENGTTHIEDDDARAAHTTGHMRWVLGIGLFLAIAILSVIWITGALTQGDVESEATVKGTQMEADNEEFRDSMDSITSDDFEEAPKATPEETIVE